MSLCSYMIPSFAIAMWENLERWWHVIVLLSVAWTRFILVVLALLPKPQVGPGIELIVE